MCYDGVWGAVCSRGWDEDDANIVCRHLGFSGSGTCTWKVLFLGYFMMFANILGATVGSPGMFGEGDGPIFYADIACGGLEEIFSDCGRGELEETGCSHSQDASMQCLPGTHGFNSACNPFQLELRSPDQGGLSGPGVGALSSIIDTIIIKKVCVCVGGGGAPCSTWNPLLPTPCVFNFGISRSIHNI